MTIAIPLSVLSHKRIDNSDIVNMMVKNNKDRNKNFTLFNYLSNRPYFRTLSKKHNAFSLLPIADNMIIIDT
ncbi:MAG: hypothetical protein LN545_01410 [Candidatus Megaira endosymbiont of Carteria cerasiformis]|nr:hypothetical protein [Candidatus Megaera polyxenophila]